MAADPRGPMVTVVEVLGIAPSTVGIGDAVYLKLSCGHTSQNNPIFHYKVGEDIHCFQCGPHGKKEAA